MKSEGDAQLKKLAKTLIGFGADLKRLCSLENVFDLKKGATLWESLAGFAAFAAFASFATTRRGH